MKPKKICVMLRPWLSSNRRIRTQWFNDLLCLNSESLALLWYKTGVFQRKWDGYEGALQCRQHKGCKLCNFWFMRWRLDYNCKALEESTFSIRISSSLTFNTVLAQAGDWVWQFKVCVTKISPSSTFHVVTITAGIQGILANNTYKIAADSTSSQSSSIVEITTWQAYLLNVGFLWACQALCYTGRTTRAAERNHQNKKQMLSVKGQYFRTRCGWSTRWETLRSTFISYNSGTKVDQGTNSQSTSCDKQTTMRMWLMIFQQFYNDCRAILPRLTTLT